MNTLRVRLILSHIVPLVVTVPLVGVALIYLLESQVLLSNLSAELQSRAAMVAETTVDQVDIWYDAENAQAFVRRVSSKLNMPVMLLNQEGDLIASSDPSDVERQGQALKLPGLDQALGGKPSLQLHYPNFLRPEFADIFMPVVGRDGRVVGVIRLTDQLEGFEQRFTELRSLIGWVLGGGLVLGALLGWGLAHTLERPLERTTQAITTLAQSSADDMSQSYPPLAERGPEEIRLLVRAFNALTERLQTLEVSRRRLLANLVHELGRPLGALRSAVQALQGGAYEDAVLRDELIFGMEGEIVRLHHLLDDLAHLHDQPLGMRELDLQAISIGEWLPGVLTPWREAAQAKLIHWQTEIGTDLPVLMADTDRLAQALGNLLSNAIKYTPEKGTIRVEAGVKSAAEENIPNSGEVFLRVSNSGQTIAAEDMKRIFAPFYRGRATTRFPQGMGLGLTIARDLVAAHGGRLEVESEAGYGNHFTIWLPVSPPASDGVMK